MLYIFDWDGTLADSVARIVSCLKLAASEGQLDVLPDLAYQEIIGLGLPEAIAQLYPQATAEQAMFLKERYSFHYPRKDISMADLFEGVDEVLSDLVAAGHLIAVATGKSRRGLDRVLATLGWQERFHATRTADETASKPHPRMVLEIIDELGVGLDDAVMVGDTEFDLEMASNAGIASIGVSFGAHSVERLQRHSPVVVVDSYREMRPHLAL